MDAFSNRYLVKRLPAVHLISLYLTVFHLSFSPNYYSNASLDLYGITTPKKDKNKCFKPVRLEMIQHHWNRSYTNKRKRFIQTVNSVRLYHVFVSTAQYIIIYSFIMITFLNRSVTLIAASVPRFVYIVDLLSSTPILPWCYGGKVHCCFLNKLIDNLAVFYCLQFLKVLSFRMKDLF